MIYLIGSLRNPAVTDLAHLLRTEGHDVFDDWHSAGKDADDSWRDYETKRGHTYEEALQGEAARHVFEFDKKWLDKSDVGILILPAGKSCHLELGYLLGAGKKGYILLDTEGVLPEDWHWLTGIYEGEGCLTRNGKKVGHGMQLTVTMKDEDIVRRLQKISGKGNIEGPYSRKNIKHAPMWRWAVRRRADILYILRGMAPHLGERRIEQMTNVTLAAGVDPLELKEGPTPKILRYDVMYQFATAVVSSKEGLLEKLKEDYGGKS